MAAAFKDAAESVNLEAAEYLRLSLGSRTLSPVLHFVKVSHGATPESSRGGGRRGIVCTSQQRIGKELVVIFNPSSSINSERQSF